MRQCFFICPSDVSLSVVVAGFICLLLLGWCSGDRCTPWENTNQEPPTDVTDAHRLGGYGILPYPPTKTPTDCTDVHRLGAKTQPKNAVSICEIRGRIYAARSFREFCEFCGRICAVCLVGAAGTAAPPERAAWVWQDAIPS